MNRSEKMLKHIKEIVCEQFEENKVVDFYMHRQEQASVLYRSEESSSYFTDSEDDMTVIGGYSDAKYDIGDAFYNL